MKEFDKTRKLAGAFVRVSIELPIDVTHTDEQRASIIEKRKAGERMWTPWKEVMPSWPIAKITYNDLGEVWTKHSEWTFEKPTKS